jgi:hypothetical protein
MEEDNLLFVSKENPLKKMTHDQWKQRAEIRRP